ncbi:glycosyltransferase family 4 protein [Luteimonas vadosa]|uniref:Glycosyltransferase family 4 protein n=1 Tax=Luteimonas vadosa TaxID=1165507 RepID=A0ABP9DRC6_9GAMM
MSKRSPGKPRLAVVISHPTQYYAPWFKYLAQEGAVELKVYYLWDFGVQNRFDPDFGHSLVWDVPLLEGYSWVMVPNRSAYPGTDAFSGLDNPQLLDLLADDPPDAILLFGYAYRTHLRLLMSSLPRSIPVLLRGDSHDIARPSHLRQRLARLARRFLFRRAAAALAVGTANRQYFLDAGMPPSRIHMVPHCVDNDRFAAATGDAAEQATAWRAELGIRADALVILFAGKFEEKKRPLDLLHAFLALRDEPGMESSGAVLLMVGAGALEGQLRACAGDRLGTDVILAPFQNQSRMPMVYAAADVLVLPSHGNGETWGLVVNEAMNMGVPCVVSTHVGCAADLVEPGQTGWVFPAGDREALTRTLRSVVECGSAERRRMGAAARSRVQEDYSYAVAGRALLEAMSSAVSAASSSGSRR